MGDFIDFGHKVKKVTKRCGSDERVVYTDIYKFNYPHSHRVQGGLRTGNGQITAALILCSDSDDKHLLWPVKLEVKVLGYKDGNTKLLGTREIPGTIKCLEEGSEEISWRNGITVSLKELQEKDIIGPDDAVTFFWSIKLSYPQPQDFQEHKIYQGNDITSCVIETNMVSKKSDGKELDNDADDLAEVEKLAAEMITCYSIDTVPQKMNLDLEIVMDKPESATFREKQTSAQKKVKQVAETYGKDSAADSQTGEGSILETRHTHISTLKSVSTSEATKLSVSLPALKTIDADLVGMLLEIGRKQNAEKQRKLTSLMSECLHGDKEKVGELISEAHTNINIQGPWGLTALMIASWIGSEEIVRLLLQHKAEVNITNSIGMNALMIATINGHTEIVKLLANAGAVVNKTEKIKPFWTEGTSSMGELSNRDLARLASCRLTCLIIAAASGQCNIVMLLLDHEVDIDTETDNGMSALKAACCTGQSEIVALLLERGGKVAFREQSMTPLMIASVIDNVDIINTLLNEGVDVNDSTAQGTTALMVAAISGSSNVVKVLIDNAAEVDAKDKRGCTPLMFASVGGALDVVNLLLDRKANADIQNRNRMTSLMYASLNGNAEIISLLLKAGAEIDARDNKGMTALVLACTNGNMDAVRCLLEHKAKIHQDCPSEFALSPNALVRASSNGHTNIVEMLLKWGAPVNSVDINGLTPLTAASIYGHPKTVKVLTQKQSRMEEGDKLNAVLHAHTNRHSEVLQILLDELQVGDSEVTRRVHKPILPASSSITSTTYWFTIITHGAKHCTDVDIWTATKRQGKNGLYTLVFWGF